MKLDDGRIESIKVPAPLPKRIGLLKSANPFHAIVKRDLYG